MRQPPNDVSVLPKHYPCLGATAAQRTQTIVVRDYSGMNEAQNLDQLALDLHVFHRSTPDEDSHPRSFIAQFNGVRHQSTDEFELALWRLLHELHLRDRSRWPVEYSNDPGQTHFRFCFDAIAWFVVGRHPLATRRSRRSEKVSLAFNPSLMFDGLRTIGKYEAFAAAIRARDESYSGVGYLSPGLNPGMGDAPQYAGEEYSSEWRCPIVNPFHKDQEQKGVLK